MSVELQITVAALATAVERNLRQQLRTTCLPPLGGASIDHLEVLPNGATVQPAGADVEVHVPVDVFIVLDTDLAAAANGTPTGATLPAGRVVFVLKVQILLKDVTAGNGSISTQSALQFSAGTPDLGDLAAKAALLGLDPDALAAPLLAAMPTVAVDLSAQLALLNLKQVSTADIVVSNGVLAVRFDATGAPTARLFPGQQWGLFIDGAGVEGLLRSKLAPAVAKLPLATLNVAWAPTGSAAHADCWIEAHVVVALEDARVTVDLPCDFSLLAGAAPVLRTSVDWTVDAELGLLGFLDEAVEIFVAQQIHPADFGASPTGNRAFVIDAPLPAIGFLGALLRYDSVLASPEGMTIGGAVVIPGAYGPPFAFTVNRLGGPLRIQNCSTLARTGSGNPSHDPLTLANTTSYGNVTINGCGTFCAIELTPAEGASGYKGFISSPPNGTVLEDATVNVTLPYDVANTMIRPLTFVVRTPRGVRLVDLGIAPKAQLAPDGHLLNAHGFFVNDCFRFVPLGDSGYGLGWGGDTSIFKPPPLENPDWDVFVRQAGGLVVQLVRVTKLEPGELLRFRSATHAIDVVADSHGRAVVPVMLPLLSAFGAARLTRANGHSLEGHVGVGSATFETHLSLPGRLASGLELTPAGHVRFALRESRKTSLHTVTALGPIAFLGADSNATELNPQPLPPGPPPERLRELAERSGLRGIAAVVFVPGFASSGAAVATLLDGTKLMLDVSHGDAVRITGSFEGPIGAIDIAGPWAVSAARRETTVLRFSAAQRTPASMHDV